MNHAEVDHPDGESKPIFETRSLWRPDSTWWMTLISPTVADFDLSDRCHLLGLNTVAPPDDLCHRRLVRYSAIHCTTLTVTDDC